MLKFLKSFFVNDERLEERRRAEREVTRRNRADQQDMTRNFDSHQQRTLRMLRGLSRPLNVLVMGPPGCGKSTFITNADFAVTNEYKEVASAGMLDSGDSFTVNLRKHIIKRQRHPLNILDVAGLANREQRGLIRCLLEGRIPLGNNLIQDGASYENLQRVYPDVCDENIIDRVLLIHSASEEIPEHICNGTVDEARGKGVEIFTLLSKTDTTEARLRVRIEDLLVRKMGTFNTVRHMSISMLCNRDDLNNDEKVRLTSHKIRSLMNELMNENYPCHSHHLHHPLQATP